MLDKPLYSLKRNQPRDAALLLTIIINYVYHLHSCLGYTLKMCWDCLSQSVEKSIYSLHFHATKNSWYRSWIDHQRVFDMCCNAISICVLYLNRCCMIMGFRQVINLKHQTCLSIHSQWRAVLPLFHTRCECYTQILVVEWSDWLYNSETSFCLPISKLFCLDLELSELALCKVWKQFQEKTFKLKALSW